MFVDAYVEKVAGTFFHQMDLFLIGTADALTGDFVCTRKHVDHNSSLQSGFLPILIPLSNKTI